MSYNLLLIDAARTAENMGKAKELNPQHQSLYKGMAEEDLSDVSPYIFSCEKNSDFSNWYAEKGWGDAWGLILKSAFTFEETYRHLKKFLLVKTENGEELYFRFYDPRVLKIFLPTCDKKQILEFFGPIESFICEGDNKNEAIIFKHKNGELTEEKIPATKMFGN
ncbi:MAG: DUF4123 domain-containing protein [Ferruginibacter sp.]